MTFGVPKEVGAEDCMNGLSGACGGPEVLAGKCTIFCEETVGFEVGEAVGACCGAPAAGIEVDLGNCGEITCLGAAELAGFALLFGGAGFIELGGLRVESCERAAVASALGVFVSELPQCGQKVDCRSSSALHLGQWKVEAGGSGGCDSVVGVAADVSCGV